MPASIQSVRTVEYEGTALVASVNRADNLGVLNDLIPVPFRPRMQILIGQVYKAAVKSNHARSYLATLEKHHVDGTFPPEIGGRIHPPALQISKEYEAASQWTATKQGLDSSILDFKKQLLATAVSAKRSEVAYLQALFSENKYKADAKAILQEVLLDLSADAGVPLKEDGSANIGGLPAWIKSDVEAFQSIYLFAPQRSIALAFSTVQSENSKKLRALSLKRRSDEDVEMQDASSQNLTVDALVSRKVEQLLKEYKMPKSQKRPSKKPQPPSRNKPGQRTGGVQRKAGKKNNKRSFNKSRN